jgi:caffeoyl-CoA O-methyltransferase
MTITFQAIKMQIRFGIILSVNVIFLFLNYLISLVLSQETEETKNLDEKIKKFLESHKAKWVDSNIPEADGKVLYNLIIKNNYQKALEIGTSTGHSAIWIARALSRTGGNLITIEIHEGRHRTALANFKETGLSHYIDARLGDAHELVKELEGPFDFVFSDADKGWHKKYFIALAPKLEVGGCFTAHNVFWNYNRGIREFIDYATSLPNFETTIDRASREGISISYKRAKD